MERIQNIWENPLYQEQFQNLQLAEQGRIFCNHTLEHFLDVARLAYILSLEQQAGLDKALIYAAALLHDIGRYAQITDGTPHEEAGAALAGEILPDCGFDEREIRIILHAIAKHRTAAHAQTGTFEAVTSDAQPEYPITLSSDAQPESSAASLLSDFIYRADKLSRCCFACPASGKCNWNTEKRNLTIKY